MMRNLISYTGWVFLPLFHVNIVTKQHMPEEWIYPLSPSFAADGKEGQSQKTGLFFPAAYIYIRVWSPALTSHKIGFSRFQQKTMWVYFLTIWRKHSCISVYKYMDLGNPYSYVKTENSSYIYVYFNKMV